ncbi:MAG: cation transporter [Nitrospirae bacterium]|nr:cation transporter [Nitrospirota bacterium]
MELSKGHRLYLTLIIGITILLGEVIGGLLSNSLALLSDAGHVFTDICALSLSMAASAIANKPVDSRATYGYRRFGLLAALINGILLVAMSVILFIETYKRFAAPPVVNSTMMLYVAAAGLIGNLLMAVVLSQGDKDLNVKSALFHVIGDLLASIGVLISAVVIHFTKFYIADPIAGFIANFLIISSGIKIIKDTVWVFLEFTPTGYNVERISELLREVPEVEGIHDVHVWSISDGVPAFSAHVLVKDRKLSEADEVRKKVEDKLNEMGIKHNVLQFECVDCGNNMLYCKGH